MTVQSPDPDQPAVGQSERDVRDELTEALRRAIERPDKIPLPPPLPPGRSAKVPPTRGRPISFNGAMARALLAGHKSQTRRPIRPPPIGAVERHGQPWPADESGAPLHCRLAATGERLWVREPWSHGAGRGAPRFEYQADFGPAVAKERRWRPGRFLPRVGSRLTLEVRGVRPERLADLAPRDAAAEGLPPAQLEADPDAAVAWFCKLWDGVYGRTEFAWEANPWVWVVSFKVLTRADERWWRPG